MPFRDMFCFPFFNAVQSMAFDQVCGVNHHSCFNNMSVVKIQVLHFTSVAVAYIFLMTLFDDFDLSCQVAFSVCSKPLM